MFDDYLIKSELISASYEYILRFRGSNKITKSEFLCWFRGKKEQVSRFAKRGRNLKRPLVKTSKFFIQINKTGPISRAIFLREKMNVFENMRLRKVE